MSNDHGRFIWYELMTSDPAAARKFYGDVVGWTFHDMPMPDMTYTVLQAEGRGIGGLAGIPADAAAMGVPPHWTGYVAVDDADAAAAKVKALGGTVLREPADIPTVGRFAIVADPAGAAITVMTPAPMDTPAEPVAPGTPGSSAWRELYGADPGTGFDFYGELFGWTRDETMDMGAMGVYQLFSNQDGQVGGMMKKPDQVPVAAWAYYFQVGQIDAAADRVKAAGGQVLNGPMEVPGGGWIVQAMDPQGAMFALFGGKT